MSTKYYGRADLSSDARTHTCCRVWPVHVSRSFAVVLCIGVQDSPFGRDGYANAGREAYKPAAPEQKPHAGCEMLLRLAAQRS